MSGVISDDNLKAEAWGQEQPSLMMPIMVRVVILE